MRKQTLAMPVLLAALAGVLPGCATRTYYVRHLPPPPPVRRSVVVGIAPGPGYVWVDSYYDWRGSWYYVPGRWVRPPHPHAVWTPGYFEHRGGKHYWRHGHWR